MATVIKSFAIQGIDGYSVDIETKMLEGQCLWQGKAYFAATMERRIIEELLDEEIIFTKWDPELVDVYIEDEGRESGISRIFILLKICESIISERYMLAIRNDGRKVSCVNQWKS